MRTLVVVRHAKAVPSAATDFDRPLRPRGAQDARLAGNWLSEAVGRPAVLMCSPARRAVETADGLLAAFADDLPAVHYRQRLYDATVGDLQSVLSDLDAELDPVVLVGHNPAVSDLVSGLSGERVELRTCGLAVLRGRFSSASDTVTLVSVTTPRAGTPD